MNYFYLAAILPYLRWAEPPGLSRDDFRELCNAHLSPRDAAAARVLLQSGDASNAAARRHRFVRGWQQTEARLRNAVARRRAKHLERDAEPYLDRDVGYGPEEEDACAEAFSASSPLAREETLDRFRWRKAEELAGFDPFTSHAILAYAVKFDLCDRWTAIDRERGEAKADEVINQKETG